MGEGVLVYGNLIANQNKYNYMVLVYSLTWLRCLRPQREYCKIMRNKRIIAAAIEHFTICAQVTCFCIPYCDIYFLQFKYRYLSL